MTELESLQKVAHHTSQTGFTSPPARADVGNTGNGVDKEFDPPVEMMVNDFDDERTLDEEEALECSEDPQTELSNLQKEKDMPLDELLAMYGYGDGIQSEGGSESSMQTNGAMNVIESQDQPPQEIKKSTKVLQQLYEPIPEKEPEQSPSTSRLLTLGRNQSDEEDDDYDYSPDEEEWRKTIMVGSDYQAAIPESLCKYDDALPYENEDKLLWNPDSLTEQQVEEYLSRARDASISTTAVGVIPTGSHSRDDEQALYLLLQCGYNADEALRRRRINAVAPQDTMSLWSEEECRNFENGLRTYGKDFHLIQLNKVRTRSVGELVQFYYLWKKTERHDIFANKARLEKKKYTLHPGITDYMDRFLEEQESGAPRDRSSSPNVYSLISGDPKRHRSQEESRLQPSDAIEVSNQGDKKEIECIEKLPGGATVELARKPDESVNQEKNRLEIGLSSTLTSTSSTTHPSTLDSDLIKDSVTQ